MADVPTLTEQQLRFAHEYASEPNATQAYLRAFPNVAYNTGRVEGPKLLLNPAIQAEVQAARRAWSKRCRVSFERIVKRLAAVAFADPIDLYEPDPENGDLPRPKPWSRVPPTARKNVVSIKLKRKRLKSPKGDDCIYELEEFEYKMLDPMAALDKLCAHLGITKGSMTADEVRAYILGTQSQATQEAPAVPPAGGVGGGDQQPADRKSVK